MSLKFKLPLVLASIAAFAVIAVVSVETYLFMSTAQQEAESRTREMGLGFAKDVTAKLEAPITLSSTMSEVITGMQTAGDEIANRESVNFVLMAILQEHPELAATWTCWEVDAFDEMDDIYGDEEGHDETGRFIPRWELNEEGEPAIAPLVGYEDPNELAYVACRETKRATMLQPRQVEIDGTKHWVTSIASPILRDGEFVGAAGVDVRLDWLQPLIEQLTLYDSGFGTVMTGDGTVIADPNVARLATNASSDSKTTADALTKISEGVPVAVSTTDPETGVELYSDFLPISIGKTGATWCLSISVPRQEVLASIYGIAWICVIVGFVTVLAAAVIGILFSRSVVRPVQVLSDYMERYAQGQLNDIESHEAYVNGSLSSRKDELGTLNAAIQRIKVYLLDNAAVARQIAEGDLSVNVKLASDEDVFGHAFRQMVTNLREIVGRVNQATERVTEGANQVAEASQSVNEGASTQAALVEEIAANMEELGDQTVRNAENANKADDLAQKATDAAGQGQEQMTLMVDAMGEITSNSTNIQAVIKVIDDIAFQTNLLALNAAVEAARAGTHGKGFAVVAEEVRNLAARSAKAASETAELIDGSRAKVDDGAGIADNTAETLVEIGGNVQETTKLVGDIASASQQQADGVAQINQQLRQIDDLTQMNSASAEETASASVSMKDQARQLQELLGHFRLEETGVATQAETHRPIEVRTVGDMMESSDELEEALTF